MSSTTNAPLLPKSPTPTNSSNQTIMDSTFKSLGSVLRLLPTGTVFLYQFLNPLLTNGGECSTTNKVVSITLGVLCGLSCFLSTFTDSYKDKDGKTQYGIATFKGFWPFSDPCSSIDYSSYKLQFGDLVHGVFASVVFAAVSLLDSNTVKCLYPSFATEQKALLMALPAVLGTISGTMFLMFPYKRHGIGYPINNQDATSTSSGDNKVAASTPEGDNKVPESTSEGDNKV